eukprot:1440479-Amphidinium_carterae.4
MRQGNSMLAPHVVECVAALNYKQPAVNRKQALQSFLLVPCGLVVWVTVRDCQARVARKGHGRQTARAKEKARKAKARILVT